MADIRGYFEQLILLMVVLDRKCLRTTVLHDLKTYVVQIFVYTFVQRFRASLLTTQHFYPRTRI